ncbi:hypothetical protein BJX96DRAFT_143569, partial [Aspergillus floccosus]
MTTTNPHIPVLLGPPRAPSLLRIMASGKCRGIITSGRINLPCPCEQGIFAISSTSNVQKRCTHCNHTIGEHEDVKSLAEDSLSVNGLDQEQQDVEKTRACKVTDTPLTCPRQDTVSAFAGIIASEPVVHVRGTPASGKTTLAYLLTAHLVKKGWNVFFLKTWGEELEHFCLGDDTAWDGLERKLQHYYPRHTSADFFGPKSLLIV